MTFAAADLLASHGVLSDEPQVSTRDLRLYYEVIESAKPRSGGRG